MQTFKKILNFAAIGSAAKVDEKLLDPTISNAMGQTGVTDGNVPVGSKVRGFVIQQGVGNVGATAIQVVSTLQYSSPAQGTVDPLAMGTSSQRSQIIKTWSRLIGPNEHSQIGGYIKIPKFLQTSKEDRRWYLTTNSNAARTQASVVIYKVRA